ncbi:SDR family oxidoreductase [Spirochaetota bacterium]
MNKIALISGASSGIGAAFAKSLASHAAAKKKRLVLPQFDELWLVARRPDRLQSLAAELRRIAPELKIRHVATDLGSPGSIHNLKQDLLSFSQNAVPISIFINNAGCGTYGDFDKTSLERSLAQLDLNCRVYTEALARLSPLLASGAVVVNTASLAAFAPLGGFAVYAATKAYCLSLSVGLAAEWKSRGIKVCALCPGPVKSEFAMVASEGAIKEVRHGWSADKTAERCLRDAAKGRQISMPRFVWRFRRFAGWLFGPELSAAFANRFMRRS